MFSLALLLCVAIPPLQDLDPDVRKLFSIAYARPILEMEPLGPDTRKVAERIKGYIRSGSPGFVAEDGSAYGIWVGTVDKLGVDPPHLLTEGDRYRLLHKGDTMIAYNVSQARHIGRDLWESSVSLRPLVLLDRYRTLCANGARSIWDPARMPRHSLFLAIIDDRQRGKRPNLVRRIAMRDEIGFIEVVGVRGDWYLLELAGAGPVAYLEVHGRTLATRPGGARAVRTVEAFWADLRKIKRLHPQDKFVSRSRARWKGCSYHIASRRKPDGTLDREGCYVWDGERLSRTDPWTIVSASFNGRYGWLLNRETGQSWLITH